MTKQHRCQTIKCITSMNRIFFLRTQNKEERFVVRQENERTTVEQFFWNLSGENTLWFQSGSSSAHLGWMTSQNEQLVFLIYLEIHETLLVRLYNKMNHAKLQFSRWDRRLTFWRNTWMLLTRNVIYFRWVTQSFLNATATKSDLMSNDFTLFLEWGCMIWWPSLWTYVAHLGSTLIEWAESYIVPHRKANKQ